MINFSGQVWRCGEADTPLSMWISCPWNPSEQSSLRKCPSLRLIRDSDFKLSFEFFDLWLRVPEPDDLLLAWASCCSGRGLAERLE